MCAICPCVFESASQSLSLAVPASAASHIFIHIAIALDYAYEQPRKFLITRENTRNVTKVEFSACGQARNMREVKKKRMKQAKIEMASNKRTEC